MNARAEAAARIGHRWDVRVLEPSPPAVDEAPWFADDPLAGGEVVPVDRAGSRSWDSLCRDDADLAAWCADRWLGGWRRLGALPSGFAATRLALHAVAEHVVAPARHRANGRIGLRYTRRGLGTPFFAADCQVRVDGDELVVQRGGDERRDAITTLAGAAALVGIAPGATHGVYAPSTPNEPDAVLAIDAEAALALADWYGFAASVLEQVRDDATDPSAAPARVQLWPEHFDLAVDLGDEAAGRRASYGGSPGDASHAEPYLYVAPWTARTGQFWADAAFGGASLSYAALLEADDQRAAALAFLRRGREELR